MTSSSTPRAAKGADDAGVPVPPASAPNAPLAATRPHALLAALPHAAWIVDLGSGLVCAANNRAALLFGRQVAQLIGRPAQELATSPEDLAYWLEAAASRLSTLDSDAIVTAADGRTLHVRRSIAPLLDGAGAPEHALVTIVDRSAERRADDDREAILADLRATLESTADGLLVTDLAGRIRAFNRRFAQMWGLPIELLERGADAELAAWMQRSVGDADDYAARVAALHEAPLVSANDRIDLLSGAVLERVTRPLWRAGRPQGRVWSFRDLTERLAAEERIETLATTDMLTGLPNRRHFGEQLDAAIQGARRDGGTLAVMVVDLDHFRRINDTLGHEMGDRALVQVAQRVQSCLRQGDRLARLGGDAFAVLLHDVDAAAAEATAKRILHVIAQPSQFDGAACTLTCSIGIALCPAHGQAVEDLVRHAEAAMRAAKQGGRAGVRLHQARVEVDRRLPMKLDHAMRQALVSGRFRLAYQPQVALADGRITAAEALLRWRDPEMGDVPPGRFIPVAEESGFIVPIGDWVLAQAVRQAALWCQRGYDLPVAVNVSALQFRQAHFVDRVSRALAVSGLPPRLLELELTESILVHDADEALARLHALARLGVRLSIDDFGTGYSNLAYLKRFPIGRLKIDRSFVQGLPEDDSDAGIVRAIVQMARALAMGVVAEGVETEAQRAFLLEAGCGEMQGFLYAPALDALSFEERLVAARVGAPDEGGGRGAAGAARQSIRLVRG